MPCLWQAGHTAVGDTARGKGRGAPTLRSLHAHTRIRPLLPLSTPLPNPRPQIASHLFVLTTSWARLLGRAFISRPAQRRARELLAREVPAVQLGPDPTRAAA